MKNGLIGSSTPDDKWHKRKTEFENRKDFAAFSRGNKTNAREAAGALNQEDALSARGSKTNVSESAEAFGLENGGLGDAGLGNVTQGERVSGARGGKDEKGEKIDHFVRSENIEALREKVKSLPLSSGVYLMKNAQGEIIYVGKAKR